MAPVTEDDVVRRARAMTALPERDRSVLIALGVMQNQVIDARNRFDRDFIPIDLGSWGLNDLMPPIITTTVFEGVYGPGEGDVA